MTILGRLGAAALKGAKAIPAVKESLERHERVAPILRAARGMAYRDLDDEAAKEALAERIAQSPGDASEALEHMTQLAGTSREDYAGDRAYRLLAAVVDGAPVAPAPPERSALFAREAALGRLPMNEAFALLAGIEPRLLEVERQAPTAELKDGDGLPSELSIRLGELVGDGAEQEDELLRSTLASSIAQQYLRALAGDSRCGPLDMPFFENPHKSFSITILSRRPKDAQRK